jgi:AraC-like DNA-binding protein
MSESNSSPRVFTGDPSQVVQVFPKFDIQVLCCRFWWLKNWEHARLSFPFWRIYYNFQEGATVIYMGKEYPLTPDKVYLIAPNTDYASRLFDHPIPQEGHTLVGGSMSYVDEEQLGQIFSEGAVEHAFIHFLLTYPYVNFRPGIFEFPADAEIVIKFRRICEALKKNNKKLDMNVYLTLHSLITGLLSELDLSKWIHSSTDGRILKAISYIESHLSGPLPNEQLAKLACITPNSFARLFKEEIGITVQQFIRQKRVDMACSLFLHTNLSIDEVALRTGFSNRYHFTRIFREVTDITPGRYKKNFFL